MEYSNNSKLGTQPTRRRRGFVEIWDKFWDDLFEKCKPKKQYHPRFVSLGFNYKTQKFPSNVICNQKYNIFTFIPYVLFNQFSVFINLLFLIMAISQFIPALRVGYLYTYWGPLIFVLAITLIREAIDDIRRWKRDREVNLAAFTKLTQTGNSIITSSQIKVGDMIWLDKNQTIPADMILLYTSEKNGTCFIRTDQLDGETDWKLRTAVPITQEYVSNHDHKPHSLMQMKVLVHAEKPNQDIYSFEGLFTRKDTYKVAEGLKECGLSLENTLWSNTVLASGSAIGLVVYTGEETRAVMNSNHAKNKFGLVDREINNISKLLIVFVIILSFVMVGLKGFTGRWPIYYWRFFLLFSYIIPLALRVNLDLAKIVYAFLIQKDKDLYGTLVRSTTISEELGRISYLMSDKTGTLTQNEMIFKKLNLGLITYSQDSMDDLERIIHTEMGKLSSGGQNGFSHDSQTVKSSNQEKLVQSVLAIAICHNVTPMAPNDDQDNNPSLLMDPIGYQASSPDEVALVNWTAKIGVTLVSRDQTSLVLRMPNKTSLLGFDIINDFPFSSESKRMGIIVKDRQTGKITLYVKGADVVLKNMVKYSPWLMEEVGNLAREALRTLVVACKSLSESEYEDFSKRLHAAKTSMDNRNRKVDEVVSSLMTDLDLLCLTGVEDKLQENVRQTLESLRNAGIKIWMLTGDKMETAECIARSSRLVGRNQQLHIFPNINDSNEAHIELNLFRRRGDASLVISGNSFEICLQYYEYEFVDLVKTCPAVIVCRCSPTQKATIVKLIREHTGKIVAAIGDGGNDVSMIQAANVGLGLEGKEGKQASLASDFSMLQFQQVLKLVLVHGRNCYKNTCNLAQFVMHRGIIISVMQAVFSAVYFFVAIQLFPGILMVGYATIFTMFPVFSLVLDKDIPDNTALTFPELYRELQKGRDLTFKTFFLWFLVSVYQGAVIMYGAILLFEDDFIHVVAITFTSLVLTELLMVALTVRTWHWLMILAEFISLGLYIIALVVLKNYFDPQFLKTWTFIWKVSLMTAVSCIPLIILKLIRMKLRPTIYSRLK